MEKDDIAKMIDHTVLKSDATKNDIIKLCDEAIEFGFFSVCVNSAFVKTAYDKLKGSDVKVCSVIGFPLGAMITEAKVFETRKAIEHGADEIDMVINIGLLKDKCFDLLEKEIKSIKNACGDKVLKVIIETCLLDECEKAIACTLATKAQADYVKTSTGFSSAGAKIEDIILMNKHISQIMKVKASGGIKTYSDAIKMIDAGASRLGTSNGISIVRGNY